VTISPRSSPVTVSPRPWARCGLHTLLVLLLVVVRATALAHEVQHVVHAHDGPCGLHDAADHLAMAPLPDAVLVTDLARAPEQLWSSRDALPFCPAPLSEARAPPFLP